mmetsp:Transcript_20811/g.38891  ORF Transcript_20811/g.38891 Transcript_20811/m.38891 type:complete len:418 (-) Transcript_20811:46-1299(-)
MDFLGNLNAELPEQQTRTNHHLPETNAGLDLKLGFDCCCVCIKPSPKIECNECRRVRYCSQECRHRDTVPTFDEGENEEEEEQALGHSKIICSLLGLCNDDELVAENRSTSVLDTQRRTAAIDRLASEFESYPATLANVIMEGPCFQETLKSRSGENLTIHVIGASEDSEFWKGHPDPAMERKVFECYADALAEVAENYKLNLINLRFFGPECPKGNIDETVSVPPVQAKKSSSKLHITSFNSDYETNEDSAMMSPDILVFFNPGFTCPDYDWEKSLLCMKNKQIPFLVTTNTEMEAVADLQYLLERRLFLDIPSGLEDLLQSEQEGADTIADPKEEQEEINESKSLSFFGVNPYAGLRVRQSGTMANDLYVKSRWIFGGTSSQESQKRRSTGDFPGGKKRRVEGSGNTKKQNPALV